MEHHISTPSKKQPLDEEESILGTTSDSGESRGSVVGNHRDNEEAVASRRQQLAQLDPGDKDGEETKLEPQSNRTQSRLTMPLNTLKTSELPDYVRQNSTTLTLPEKLVLMLTYVERESAQAGRKSDEESIGWINEGRAFVVRNKDHATANWLVRFFGRTKYSSFTRKLYRWGFRKMTKRSEEPNETSITIFGHEHFQRDNLDLMSKMKSITAAKLRSEMAQGIPATDPSWAQPEVDPRVRSRKPSAQPVPNVANLLHSTNDSLWQPNIHAALVQQSLVNNNPPNRGLSASIQQQLLNLSLPTQHGIPFQVPMLQPPMLPFASSSTGVDPRLTQLLHNVHMQAQIEQHRQSAAAFQAAASSDNTEREGLESLIQSLLGNSPPAPPPPDS